MADIIIVVIIVVLLGFALKSSIKHFKGEGACCGGGSSPKKTKEKTLDGPVIGRKTVKIAGMHCEHCKVRVEEAVNDIHGAAGRADWKKGLLTVLYSQPVDDGQIKQRVEKAGYRITGVL